MDSLLPTTHKHLFSRCHKMTSKDVSLVLTNCHSVRFPNRCRLGPRFAKRFPLTFLLSKYNRYLHIFPPILHAYSPFCFSITLGARHFHTGPAECVKAAGQRLILQTCPRQTGSDTGCHILYSIFFKWQNVDIARAILRCYISSLGLSRKPLLDY